MVAFNNGASKIYRPAWEMGFANRFWRPTLIPVAAALRYPNSAGNAARTSAFFSTLISRKPRRRAYTPAFSSSGQPFTNDLDAL